MDARVRPNSIQNQYLENSITSRRPFEENINLFEFRNFRIIVIYVEIVHSAGVVFLLARRSLAETTNIAANIMNVLNFIKQYHA